MIKGHYLINRFVECNKSIFFVPANMNVLVEYSVERKEEVQIVELPKIRFEGMNAYMGILALENRIVVLPNHSDRFLIYSIASKEINEISIPMDGIECNQWGFFSYGYIYEKSIYVVGHVYPGIVRIDIENMTCDIVARFNEGIRKKRGSCFAFDSIMIDEDIYALCLDENRLFRYNVKKDYKELINIDNSNNEHYLTISREGSSIWIVGSKNLYVYDTNTKESRIFNFVNSTIYYNDLGEGYSVIVQGHLIIGRDNEAPILRVPIHDPNSMEIIWKKGNIDSGYSIYGFFIDKNDNIIFLDKISHKVYTMDPQSGEIKPMHIESDIRRLIDLGLMNKQGIYSEDDISLDEYLSYINSI